MNEYEFPISRDPPEGGTVLKALGFTGADFMFPISRDPPEGGTAVSNKLLPLCIEFPISRDPPEGGTDLRQIDRIFQTIKVSNF